MQIAAGSAHTLILRADSALYACGRNTAGQLGLGASGHDAPPVLCLTRIAALSGLEVHDVRADADTSAALVGDCGDAAGGALYRWGGALYRWGGAPSQPAPVALPALVEGAAPPP